jgi:hypothetical protein
LFVDKDHAWAIDFERSGISHSLRDFVELEQNIITRLMILPEKDTYLLYSLAVYLTKAVSVGEPIDIPPDLERNGEIKKAVEVINGLRSMAHKVTRYRDIREYYWGLLMETAFSLTLVDADSPRWWRSLLLSSVLCSRLNNWGSEWPSAEMPSLDLHHRSLTNTELESQQEVIGGNVTNTYQIGNITIGNASKVDIILANEIKKSFNKVDKADIQPELKETLKQLTAAVDAMNQSLTKEQAAEVTDDLTKLVDEATKPMPNRKWYSVSIDGLIKAAENVEKVGDPVLNLSRKVLSILTGGLIE